jgi:hypothetical protein
MVRSGLVAGSGVRKVAVSAFSLVFLPCWFASQAGLYLTVGYGLGGCQVPFRISFSHSATISANSSSLHHSSGNSSWSGSGVVTIYATLGSGDDDTLAHAATAMYLSVATITLLAGKPVKYRTQGTWLMRHVKVRIGSSLPHVIGGERIGSKTEDYVFYVRCPRWVGSGSNSA